MADPKPPKGYELQGSNIKLPDDLKMSPDIEDRRNAGSISNAVGLQKQDFLHWWGDFRRTYPNVHEAYSVVKDALQNKKHTPPPEAPLANIPEFGTNIPAAPKVGDTKKFKNGKIGKWDGHGWVAQ